MQGAGPTTTDTAATTNATEDANEKECPKESV